MTNPMRREAPCDLEEEHLKSREVGGEEICCLTVTYLPSAEWIWDFCGEYLGMSVSGYGSRHSKCGESLGYSVSGYVDSGAPLSP